MVKEYRQVHICYYGKIIDYNKYKTIYIIKFYTDDIYLDIRYFSVSFSTGFINSINKYDIICSILINYHNAENSN